MPVIDSAQKAVLGTAEDHYILAHRGATQKATIVLTADEEKALQLKSQREAEAEAEGD